MLDIKMDAVLDAPLVQLVLAQIPKFYDVKVVGLGNDTVKVSNSRRAVRVAIHSLVGKTYAEVRKMLSAIVKSGGFVLRSATPVRTSRYVAPANEMYTSRSLHGDDDEYPCLDPETETPFDTPDVGVDMGIEPPVMEHGHDEDGCGFGTFPVLPPMEGDIDMGIGLTADAAYGAA